MSQNKLGKYMIIGALTGAVVSMFDRSTRESVLQSSNRLISDVRYYSKNPAVLKAKFEQQKEKYQQLWSQLAEDADYVKEQFDQLKTLTPQVKEAVINTKEAFVETKDGVKEIVQTGKGDDQ